MLANKNDSILMREIAEVSRMEGNKLYKERCFFDALVKYNESLCQAEVGSSDVGLAFANRSAVYYEVKLFEKCLKNIQLAKTNGYSVNNFAVLDKRAERCAEQMKAGCDASKAENPFDSIKLTYAANPKLPFVADCLEIKKSPKFGRYIITNSNLRVGDIVAIEKPFFQTIKSDSRYEGCLEMNKYQRCTYCLKDNLMDLIPCQTCSSSEF